GAQGRPRWGGLLRRVAAAGSGHHHQDKRSRGQLRPRSEDGVLGETRRSEAGDPGEDGYSESGKFGVAAAATGRAPQCGRPAARGSRSPTHRSRIVDRMLQVPVLTLGHGTLSAEEFTALAGRAGISAVVDVRSFPGSRHNPQFKRDRMAEWLAEAGLGYTWEPRLGGRRRGLGAQSRHTGLRHEAFRAYADWMETEEFTAGLADTLALAARTAEQAATEQGPADQAATEQGPADQAATEQGPADQAATEQGPADQAATEQNGSDAGPPAGRTALMCSETVWWRCHRRLITDHLVLIEQVRVRHLMHDGRLQEPHVTPEAR